MKIELIAKEGIEAEVEFIAMDSSDLQRVDTPSVYGVRLANGEYALLEVCDGKDDIITLCDKETAFDYKAV